MNVNEIDAHVDAHLAESANMDMKAINICNVYRAARPVIMFAKALLFWKPKWQAVVTALVEQLDITCPA